MRQKIIQLALLSLHLFLACFLYFFIDFIHRGGIGMVPLLFCSSVSSALIFAKIKQLNIETISTADFLKNIFDSIERQRIKEALELCEQSQTIVSRVIKSGIMKYDRPKDEIKGIMEDTFLYETPILEANLSLISTMIQVMPLLGLVGALLGFMKTFEVMQMKMGLFAGVSAFDVAPGLWQAMISSLAGLVVSIPILIAYNYLSSRIKDINNEIESAAAEFLNFLMERRMPL